MNRMFAIQMKAEGKCFEMKTQTRVRMTLMSEPTPAAFPKTGRTAKSSVFETFPGAAVVVVGGAVVVDDDDVEEDEGETTSEKLPFEMLTMAIAMTAQT